MRWHGFRTFTPARQVGRDNRVCAGSFDATDRAVPPAVLGGCELCHPRDLREDHGPQAVAVRGATEPESETEGLLVEFAEQFSADVSAVTPEQRSTLMAAFGAEVLGIAALMFVADFGPRVSAGLTALGVPVREPEAWDNQTHPADALLNRFTSPSARCTGWIR